VLTRRVQQDSVGRAATRLPLAHMETTGINGLLTIANSEVTTPDIIGAKAHSLQQLSAFGFRVPFAFVIPAAFFHPWFATIKQLPCWEAWLASRRDQWQDHCNTVRESALILPVSEAQRLVLNTLAVHLAAHGPAQRFAVRSSAPDEDSAAASFAGLYETELGVSAAGMEEAIRRCFAASLDYRVFEYKAVHGMNLDRLSMALIVQLQIDSEVAGVGFSINPLTNDFDESAIDANWGLGESVVSGMATPDHFVLNKTSGAIKEQKLGAKQNSVTLSPIAGTISGVHPRHTEYCLSEDRLFELNSVICQIEALYGHPVDIEWAYAHGELFILQARPITSYVPLPAEMLTAPGAQRKLYMDIALSKGMTINAAISPIGLDWLGGDMANMLRHCIGKVALDVQSPDGLLYLGGGRMYMNLSNLLWFSSPKQLAKGSAATDQLMADTLSGIDASFYRAPQRPAWILPVLRVMPGAIWRLRRALWRTIRSTIAPESTYRRYQREKQLFEKTYSGLTDDGLPLAQFQRRYGAPAIAHIIDIDMPALGVGVLASAMVQRLVRGQGTEAMVLADRLSRGIPGNLVVEMGIRIFQMSKMLEAAAFENLDDLRAKVEQRRLPENFLAAWDAFMHSFGCRGPGEMDLANSHYGDDPMILLRQMSYMANSGADFDPEAHHRRLVQERQLAYEALLRRFGWFRRALLRHVYKLSERFGGTRDTPKQHNLLYQHAARKRLLVEGTRFVAAGRLDRPEQVFDLAVSDLLAAGSNASLDLRELGRQRVLFANKLRNHVRTFPAVVDSRGRIQRPLRRAEKPGELTGMAVSPGVVTGRIKLMRDAHEKRVEKGEILVAFTTDPGWTPLFVNAAAVILEVGGVLQHGAVVAREYGKPCVAGIPDVLNCFVDGQLVEVDGTAGVVRIIPTPASGEQITVSDPNLAHQSENSKESTPQ
jgi:phosphohistidine swiveling domain-containing protein